MAPKKATTGAPKAASSAASHTSYKDMIKQAIVSLKEVRGSSRQAITKHIKANNKLTLTDAAIQSHINAALRAGEKSGEFLRPKGSSGTVKLAKKGDAPKTAAAKPAAKTAKPAAAKSTTAAKKPATKKAAAPAAKKTASTTTTTKTKANVAKPRKPAAKKTATATAAPAVEDKKPVALTKTKSGRVSKGQPTTAKKAAPKKTTTKKAAAPKKAAATPKKASASPKKASSTPAA